MTPTQSLRVLEIVTRTVGLLRAGAGNPNHRPSGPGGGQFTGGGGSGGGQGKHHARRQRRKLRKLKARHKAERVEHRHQVASDRKALAREHAREHRAIDRRHAGRLAAHAKTAPVRHEAVDKAHATKAERIAGGEAKAKGTEERHEAERKAFEKTAGGDRGYLHKANEKLYESQRKQLKEKDGSEADHAALEQRIDEHRAKFADPHAGLRKAQEEQHGRERARAAAFLAKSGTLKERLARQTAAKHARIDRTPERLEDRHRTEKAEASVEHARAREDQREEHLEERRGIRRRQGRERRKAGGSRGGDVPVARPPPKSERGMRDGDATADQRPQPGDAAILSRGAITEDEVQSVARAEVPGRFSPHRTHKASNAESILRHCLRRLGLSRQWRRGELTDEQHLALADEVRRYARAWLRHEAEGLFRWHGRTDGADLVPGAGVTGPGMGGGRSARHVGFVPATPDQQGDPGGLRAAADRGVDEAGGSPGVSNEPRRSDRDNHSGAGGHRDLLGRVRLRSVVDGEIAGEDPGADGVEGVSDGSGEQPSDGAVGDLRGSPGFHDGPRAQRWGADDFLDDPAEIIRAFAPGVRHAVGRFFDRVRGFLKEAILAGAMALNGPEPPDAEDLAEVDRQHAVQVAFLDNFARDAAIRTPEPLADPAAPPLMNGMTPAEFVARAEMYGGASYTGAMAVNRRKILGAGVAVRERRVHRRRNPELHACATCLAESDKGWVPIGNLLPIGDAECLTMCDCYVIYGMEDGTEFITARGWKRAA